MSNWTHVAGVMRIDDFRFERSDVMNFDEIIGKECHYDSTEDIWMDLETNPDKYLPVGSEGTLRKSIWINPDTSHMAAYTVTVFGDLRDHDDTDGIINWFKDICKKVHPRNAVITATNELFGTKTWTYEDFD